MDKKIIAVMGATGAQGGGLVRAILADKSGEFAVRAITRKPDSDKAQALAKLGVEVVAGDLDDVASLTKAFEGAYGAYCVTNFWEHFSGEKGDGPGARPGPGGQERGREARHLVHLRGHAQGISAQRLAHADAERASTRCRTSMPRPRRTISSGIWACRPRSC
jgi:uncharacterized protein YbjT (DUF2867 family)